ncbi:MAG TPA: hypothetical protein VFQ41_14180 [Candidatus Angelobacter sp.]|nr:hypothetical protein [Candidatus Angelobacter sp.]
MRISVLAHCGLAHFEIMRVSGNCILFDVDWSRHVACNRELLNMVGSAYRMVL